MFSSRKELLFVYSVKDANPNGDPLNANHPRYDDETQQTLVSDVRIKRTVRDEFLRKNHDVFIDGEPKTLNNRIKELKEKLGTESSEETLKKCIDTRLFGVTFALGNDSFAWTGPVQFKWGRSLHKVKVEFVQGTGAFLSKETSEQRTIRNEYKVPFALIATYAIANENASKTTDATDEDFKAMVNALWDGTNNLVTRSKTEHRSRFLMVIEYNDDYNNHIGSLDEKVLITKPDGSKFTEDEELSIRKMEDLTLDITKIVEKIPVQSVKKVSVYKDSDTKVKGIEELKEKLGDGKIELIIR